MQPRIELLKEKKLIGINQLMCLSDYNVAELWQKFNKTRNQISNRVSNDLFSLAIYPPLYFQKFNPNSNFERWAAVEVSTFDDIPLSMQSFCLQEGLYAVFHHKGLQTDMALFEYIYGSWLPSSDYILDNRPHFELLGELYKNNDPNSEEEVWIPISLK